MVYHYEERFQELPDLYACTFTLDPQSVCTRNTAEYAEALRVVWSSTLKNIGDRCGKRGLTRHYVGVIEGLRPTLEEAQPHIHALVSCPLPDAEHLLRDLWYQYGGSLNADVISIAADEVAAWLRYLHKEQFDASLARRQPLTSNGIGYYSKKARLERRKYVHRDGPEVEVTSITEPRRGGSGGGRRPCLVKPAEIDLARRKRRHVRWFDGLLYGVQTRVSDSSDLVYDAVRRDNEETRKVAAVLEEGLASPGAAAETIDAVTSEGVT